MNRPVLEVADLVRAAGDTFIERSRRWIRWKHVKVLLAIARCRTATLGGHIDECSGCGHRTTISYNSCRDRHCSKCQTAARDRWIEARRQELLPTRYVHVVFTLPRHLAPLVLQNKKLLYDLLFAERGRNYTPLRSATLTGTKSPFAVASRLEHRLNQAKHPTIRYSLGYQREKLLVIHRSEGLYCF